MSSFFLGHLILSIFVLSSFFLSSFFLSSFFLSGYFLSGFYLSSFFLSSLLSRSNVISVKIVLLTTITVSKRTVIFTTALWGSHGHVGWVTSTDSAAEGVTIGEFSAAFSIHTGLGAAFDTYHTSVVVMPVTVS